MELFQPMFDNIKEQNENIKQHIDDQFQNVIKERETTEFRRLIANQCQYCMRIMANNSGATSHEAHTCASRDFANMRLNIDGHLLLALCDAISNVEDDDILHELKVIERNPEKIVVKIPYMRKSKKRGVPAEKKWCKYNFSQFKHRLSAFKRISEIYYVDLRMLVNKATREFLERNKELLGIMYSEIPEDGEYSYTNELQAKINELGY